MGDQDWAVVQTLDEESHAQHLAALLASRQFETRVLRVVWPGDRNMPARIEYEVYVPKGHQPAAAQALDELLQVEPDPVAPTLNDGCPAHGASLDTPCRRCGTFMCSQCVNDGAEPLCDDCDSKLFESERRDRPALVDRRMLIAGGLLFAALVYSLVTH